MNANSASSSSGTTTTTTTTSSVLVSKTTLLNTTSNTPTTPTATQTASANSNFNFNLSNINIMQHEEKVYKKEKQILVEFDSKTKDLKSQLNDGIKCLEQRLDTQISILYELQDFFKKRAEVEAQYSRDLDKLTKQVLAKHKSEKTKRESWQFHSAFKLWEALINDTKQHSKYHQVAGEVCSKYVAEKFDEIIEDIKRIFSKCKVVGQSLHEEIFKVVGELNGAMKTYHEYQSESKQAEAKLKYVQSQKPKFEKQKSKKKLKQYEKQVEKRLQKYTETKVKAFKARNEYILSIDSANACINKFCNEDIGDMVDCMDFGFHASVARCIYMYLSAQENVKRSRQLTVDNLNRNIGDLDSNSDKLNYLDNFSFVFNIQKKFSFEPHKGDEVSQVNAQSLIRYEMEKRFEQLDNRLKTLKTENNEIFKTIEATESSLLNFFDVKNCDMSDLFRDLNLTNLVSSVNTKDKRIEIEDYYVEKVRQYTISSNLIARLEARHSMMQKALNGCVNNSEKLSKENLTSSSNGNTATNTMNSNDLMNSQKIKKKIGKSPIIGQPRLFGGKLVEYINATKQEIPPIITSCIKAINRLGLHNQGIFRIPGSQLEINQFKEAFEKGEDPLITVNPREMNSVAGVLKLYLRELKDPLFPRDMYDTFLNAIRVSSNQMSPPSTPKSPINTINNSSDSLSSSSPNCIHVENLEAHKIENIKRAIYGVPKPIYIVLRYLFTFLNHLSEFKDENMMDAYNIAICLAPTLIPVPEEKKDQVNHQTDTIEFIKIIIQNSDEIFSMECEGPFYEKFDSEIDNEENEENIEESEDEEEGDESDRQFMRNLSDDELYVTEAIALYDYKGRSDKEISFKKGDWLAIRGQLSADWWHGSLLQQSKDFPCKLGYIPDKYVALRSSKRKFSSSLISTPQSQSVHTPSSSCMSASMTTKTPTLAKQALAQQYRDNNMSNIIDLDKSHLNELLKVKESHILNDDENESIKNGFNNRFNQNNCSNSYSIINSLAKNQSAKVRNLSASSSLIDQSIKNCQSDSFTLKSNNNTLSKNNSPTQINSNRALKFENSIYSSNQNKSKMNHIEDALASVLDDMKQLDFSTTPNASSQSNKNPIFDSIKKNGTHLNSNSSATSTPSSYSSQSSSNSSNGILKNNLYLNTINGPKLNRKEDFVSSQLQHLGDEFQIKPASVNKENKNKRPDLVLDLPINLIAMPTTTSTAINLNNQFMSTMPNQKVRRKSLDRTNTSDAIAKLTSTPPNLSRNLNNSSVKDKLHCSSTSSTESSSLSSAASLNILLADQTNKQQNTDNALQRSNKLLLMSAAAEAAANAALLNNPVLTNCNNGTKINTDEMMSILKNPNQSTPNSVTDNQLRTFNFDLNRTGEDSMTSLNSSLLFNNKNSIDTNVAPALCLFNDQENKPNEQNFKNKLNQFKNSNYCTANDFNLFALELNMDNSEKQTTDENSFQSACNTLKKNPPPPVMKKPEKSQEIMRKLGRSPPVVLDQQQNVSSNKSLSSSSSTISSLPSTDAANGAGGSPINSDSSKVNLSIRLSNSKATDV